MITTVMDRVFRSASVWLLASLVITTVTTPASADDETLLVNTESPRATLQSFLRLRDEGEQAIQQYWADQNQANFDRVLSLSSEFTELLDLSSVPRASHREAASDTIDKLLDIFGRVELPPLEGVPGADSTDGAGIPTKWRVPGTPIWIAQVDDGPREGEYLFSERTVNVAPVFYERIRHLPLRTSLGFESWTEAIAQLHGPLIPAAFVSSLPDGQWNDFFAIREDVFLRVNKIVAESGTGFAFPSQTLYLGRDGGLDKERSQSAVEQVAAWRRSGTLPFPVMEPSKIEKLADTLDYPPRGSPGTEVAVTSEAMESLSTEPEPDVPQPDERAKET